MFTDKNARQRPNGSTCRIRWLSNQQAITDSLATDSITTDSLAILNQKEIEKLEAPVDTALLAKEKAAPVLFDENKDTDAEEVQKKAS